MKERMDLRKETKEGTEKITEGEEIRKREVK